VKSEKVKSRTLSHSGFLSLVSAKELGENRGVFSIFYFILQYFNKTLGIPFLIANLMLFHKWIVKFLVINT